MEYDCATLVREVRRAEMQVEHDRELVKLYPPHLAHEKQQIVRTFLRAHVLGFSSFSSVRRPVKG
jgi:hypothetical protein